jgi:putative protein kinase ArgK-like GTPase of G3E family
VPAGTFPAQGNRRNVARAHFLVENVRKAAQGVMRSIVVAVLPNFTLPHEVTTYVP